MRVRLRPADEASGVAAVGVDPLDEGKAAPGPLQHAFCAVAVLNVGGMDLDRQQATVGVGQDMTLAPVDALSVRRACAAPPGPRSPLTVAFEAPF